MPRECCSLDGCALTRHADEPPNPVVHTHLGPDVTPFKVIPITATFDASVTGVVIKDFNYGVDFPVETGVSYALSGSGSEWVLTVTVDTIPRVDKDFAFGFVTASGSISPPNEATPTPLSIKSVPW